MSVDLNKNARAGKPMQKTIVISRGSYCNYKLHRLSYHFTALLASNCIKTCKKTWFEFGKNFKHRDRDIPPTD